MSSDSIRVVASTKTGIFVLSARPGDNLMRLAVRSNLPGIEAECGGSCNCGTCHVYLSSEFAAALPPAAADEDAMLEMVAAERQPTSRLACQIHLPAGVAELGLVVPDRQY